MDLLLDRLLRVGNKAAEIAIADIHVDPQGQSCILALDHRRPIDDRNISNGSQRDRRAGKLSGGMQRRLELACALVHDPDVLFLDEPTAGIDPLLRRTLWDELHRLRDRGRTLVVTTQYVGEAEECDAVALISEGRLVALAAPDELRRMATGGEVLEIETTTPIDPELIARQPSVLQALYMLFNEGFHGSDPREPIHPAMCTDAIRLGELLLELDATTHTEIHALVAMFCFHAARLPARLDDDGVFVPLADQDRQRWDRLLVRRGLAALERIEPNAGTRASLDDLRRLIPLGAAIESFWLAPAHRATAAFAAHRDISEVMLATRLVPEGFLLS